MAFGKFTCLLCPNYSGSVAMRRAHMQLHSVESTLSCRQCSTSFKGSCDLWRHMLSHTRTDQTESNKPVVQPSTENKNANCTENCLSDVTESAVCYKCSICQKVFHHHSNRQAHMIAHFRGVVFYKCPKCGARFKFPNFLSKHMEMCVAKQQNDRTVDECSMPDAADNSTITSSATLDVEELASKCRMHFGRLDPLRLSSAFWKDKPVHLGTANVKHEAVEGSADSGLHVMQSTREHMDGQNTRLSSTVGQGTQSKCPICGKMLSRDYFDIHLNAHMFAKLKVHKCQTCSQTFNYRINLISHMQIMHSSSANHTKLSGFRKVMSATHAEYHKTVHSGDKPYSCSDCGWRCNFRTNMYHHKRMYCSSRATETINKSKCGICQKLVSASHAKHHMRVHSDEKPYSCLNCGWRCKFLTSMSHHRKMGCSSRATEKINKSICRICQKLVSVSYAKHHMRVHSEEKPYSCLNCGWRCKFLASMSYHGKKCAPILKRATPSQTGSEAIPEIDAEIRAISASQLQRDSHAVLRSVDTNLKAEPLDSDAAAERTHTGLAQDDVDVMSKAYGDMPPDALFHVDEINSPLSVVRIDYLLSFDSKLRMKPVVIIKERYFSSIGVDN